MLHTTFKGCTGKIWLKKRHCPRPNSRDFSENCFGLMLTRQTDTGVDAGMEANLLILLTEWIPIDVPIC